jgi:hypothetical protein
VSPDLIFLLGGIGIGATVATGIWWMVDRFAPEGWARSRRSRPSTNGAPPSGPFSAPVRTNPDPATNILGPPSPSHDVRPEFGQRPRPVGPERVVAPSAEPASRLSERIVVHLARVGRVGADELGRLEMTQRGMGTALGADQSALSKVLRRLVAAGALDETRRHVRGSGRRVKVYSLTRRGESIAREIRTRYNLPPILPEYRDRNA